MNGVEEDKHHQQQRERLKVTLWVVLCSKSNCILTFGKLVISPTNTIVM